MGRPQIEDSAGRVFTAVRSQGAFGNPFADIGIGDAVEFDVRYGPAVYGVRFAAINVTVTAQSSQSRRFTAPASGNPFSVLPVRNFDDFSGRVVEFRRLANAVMNGRSVFITGETGVGKTSIALQLINLLEHKIERSTLDSIFGDNWSLPKSHITLRASCSQLATPVTIINDLTESLNSFSRWWRRRKTTDSLEVSAGVVKLGRKYERVDSEQRSPSARLTDVVTQAFRFTKAGGGVAVFLDDVDRSCQDRAEAGILTDLLKGSMESLHLRERSRVVFIVSGVSSFATGLAVSNVSISRLFEFMELPRMSREDLEDILRKRLRNTPLQIEQPAREEAAEIADGFPYAVQLIGFHMYNVAREPVLNVSSVVRALNEILDQKTQTYQQLLLAMNVDERRIAVAASRSGSWTSAEQLAFSANLRESVVRDVLYEGEHMALRSLLSYDGDRVRLRDPLFRQYVLRRLTGAVPFSI